jgi:hypothetical protein
MVAWWRGGVQITEIKIVRVTHLLSLIIDVNSARLVFALVVVQLGEKRRADHQVLEAVAVHVGRAHRVSKIGSQLRSGHVENVHQIPGVKKNLKIYRQIHNINPVLE